MRHFTFLHAIKVWLLEGDLAWLQGPEFSGTGECKRLSSRDRKIFPAFGNAKGYASRDPKSPEDFSGRENSGTNRKNFFCYMYELSLRHPVWAAEINVTACNSVLYRAVW
jgi:hypothetical protein